MTNLLYLDDSYRYESSSEIETVAADERGSYVVLASTVFYPQGGGQPADKGTLEIEGRHIPVQFVGFTDGHVRHYIAEDAAQCIPIGAEARQHVDGAYRQANARLHTGGHHVSHVLETLDDRLIPIKGYHFPDGSYIELVNDQGIDGNALIVAANERLAADVVARLPIVAALADYATIEAVRPYLAPNIPQGKPTRMVTIGNYRSLPCGGTHVSNLGELGSIRITKVKNNKGNLKVSYEIAGNSTEHAP